MTSINRVTAIRALAVGLVLASGGMLVLAGSLVGSARWAVAGLIATVAGIVTQAAFYLGRRTERPASYVRSMQRARPRPGERRRSIVGAWLLMMLSGLMMAAGGYLGASEDWPFAGPLMVLAGPVIGGAYLLERLARAP